MRIPIPFAHQHGERKDKLVSSEKLINWSAHKTEVRGKEGFILIQRPGLVLEATIGIGPHRGSIEHDGVMYVVSGNGFYTVSTAQTVLFIGSIGTYTGRVSMDNNGTEIIIVDGQDGWIYNITAATLTQIADVDFVDAKQVIFFHGRFVVTKPGTGEFYISALYDGTSWAALDYANAEVDPDDLLSAVVTHQELWMFGEYTMESYLDTGNQLFPFEAQPGGFVEWGIAAIFSVAKGDNTVIWLAKNRSGQANVLVATGFSPKIVSTPAMEEAIAEYSTISDAYAFVIKPDNKDLFYVLTFPTANVTWVFNFSTRLWNKWESYGVGRFKIATHCFFNNKHYMGSSTDGKLYSLDSDTFTDDSDPLIRIATTQPYSDSQNRMKWDSLEVLFETGSGISTGQGSDPQAMLRWSDDGGHTYGNSIWRDIGKIGEYLIRSIWNKLGISRNRVYELTISDPVRATVIGAFAEVRKAKN